MWLPPRCVLGTVMELAILFFFYKDPVLCRNRLQLLRRHNPITPIYGLYGGDSTKVDTHRSTLAEYLDDFYAFTQDRDSDWKWREGDLIITDWFRERGKNLAWDTIVVIQWDTLVLGPINKLFSMVRKNQILLSGLRPIKEVESWWSWVSNPDFREHYLEFLEYVRDKYDFDQEPLCCLFLVACLPKTFLEKYSRVEKPEMGFLEYRLPIYGQIFGIPFCMEHPFKPWWADDIATKKHPSRKILKAGGYKIALRTIFKRLLSPKGPRVFHPYIEMYPIGSLEWSQRLLRNITKRLLEAARFKIGGE